MKNIFSLILFLGLFLHAGAQCIQWQNCPGTQPVCDLTPNDAQLWHETYWWDAANQLHDLADAPVQFSTTVSDTCSGATLGLRCLLFLDLDGDGMEETVVDSWNLPAPGTVNYNNINNPGYTGGEVRSFDERPVTADNKYRFCLDSVWNGNTLTATIRWNTQADPGAFVDVQLPYMTGKVQWLADDNLGNSDVCTTTFDVRDCKKPTVVCINGLSVNIMPTGLISLWATDFLQYADDNFTQNQYLKFGVRKCGQGTGFPVDGNGNPIINVIFDCTELGTQCVELWAMDQAGNADFCETYVLVQDNLGNCAGTGNTTMEVCIKRWCDGSPVSVANLEINGTSPFTPPFSYFFTGTDISPNGCWYWGIGNQIPLGSNFTITPTIDDNPNNGVTPLDLIKISKHILGVEALGSPYAMIAADINKSNSITTFDMVEGRKLITGIYAEFPNNTSWRFVDADFVFPNPSNPFQSVIPESIEIVNLLDSLIHQSFVAIKIGDVDCDGNPGFQATPDNRSLATLQLPDAVLEPGESVEIPVTISESGNFEAIAAGFSFDPDALVLEAAVPGAVKGMSPDDFVQPGPGVLNALWINAEPQILDAGQQLFTLHLRARKHLRLSEALHLTAQHQPHFMRSEYYDGRDKAGDLQLTFRGSVLPESNEQTIAAQPNPTPGASWLPFRLSSETTVRLSLTDLGGRLLYSREQVMPAGLQMMEIPESAMPASGCYFWRIEAAALTASGKLIKN